MRTQPGAHHLSRRHSCLQKITGQNTPKVTTPPKCLPASKHLFTQGGKNISWPMAHPSRTVPTFLLWDFKGAHDRDEMGKGAGTGQGSLCRSKAGGGRRKAEAAHQGWFFPVYLTNAIIPNTFAATAPALSDQAHILGVQPLLHGGCLLDPLYQPPLSSCF